MTITDDDARIDALPHDELTAEVAALSATTTIVRFWGEEDASSHDTFVHALRGALEHCEARATGLVVDLCELTSVSVRGLMALVALEHDARTRGVTAVLVAPRRHVVTRLAALLVPRLDLCHAATSAGV